MKNILGPGILKEFKHLLYAQPIKDELEVIIYTRKEAFYCEISYLLIRFAVPLGKAGVTIIIIHVFSFLPNGKKSK